MMLLIDFLALMVFSFNASAADGIINKHVTPVPVNYDYKGDIDDADFRINVSKSNNGKIIKNLINNPSNLCSFVTKKDLLDYGTSSKYVLSVLRASGAIDEYDKSYSLISAHFLWEYYLTYRNFVDISNAFSGVPAQLVFDKLPEGYIVQVETGCVKNGAVAIKCKNGFYTTKFPNIKKLVQRLDDPFNKSCKFSNGLKLIVESSRLYEAFQFERIPASE